MKAYPKPEKEVICFECKKPILSRDDLFLIKEKSSRSKHKLEPIHVDCYGRMFRKNQDLKPVKPMKPIGYVIGTLMALCIIGIILYFFSLLGSIDNTINFLAIFFLFSISLTLIGLLMKDFISDLRKSKFIRKLNKSLPASCRQCTRNMLPGEIICSACGWKYGQFASKQKMKH